MKKRAAMDPSSTDVLDLELTKANMVMNTFSRHIVLRKTEGRVLLLEAAALPQPLSPEKAAEGFTVDPLSPTLGFADGGLTGGKLRCYRLLHSYPAGAAPFGAKYIMSQMLAELEAGVAPGCECIGAFGSMRLTLRLPRLPPMTAEILHSGGASLPGGFAPGTKGFDAFFFVPTDGSRAWCLAPILFFKWRALTPTPPALPLSLQSHRPAQWTALARTPPSCRRWPRQRGTARR